jgi:hypothetical protein
MTNQSAVVDVSIGYINNQICTYEISDVHRTVRTAYVRASDTCLLRLARQLVGVHQTGEEFPNVQVYGDSWKAYVSEGVVSNSQRVRRKDYLISSVAGFSLREQERMVTSARSRMSIGRANADRFYSATKPSVPIHDCARSCRFFL